MDINKEFEEKYCAFELCEVVKKKEMDNFKNFINQKLKEKDDALEFIMKSQNAEMKQVRIELIKNI